MIAQILGLAIGLVLILGAIISPYFGLLGMIALIPGEELVRLPIGITFIFVLGVITFLSWLVRSLLFRKPLRIDIIPISLFLLWLILGFGSLIWAENSNLVIRRVILFGQFGLFVILIQNLIDSKNKIESVIIVYFIASFFVSLVGIYRVITLGLNRMVAVEGQDPNNFGHALGIALTFAPLVVARSRGVVKIFFVIGSLLIAFAMLLTGSRGGFISLLGTIILSLMLFGRKLSKITILFTFTSSFAILLSFLIIRVNPILGERLQMFFTPERMIDLGRLRIWRVGVEILKNNWLLGVGFGNFEVAFNEFIVEAKVAGLLGLGKDPHNVFLSVFSELGIFGFLIFMVFLLTIFRKAYRNSISLEGFCLFLALVFSLFYSLTLTVYFKKRFWFCVGLILANPNLGRDDAK